MMTLFLYTSITQNSNERVREIQQNMEKLLLAIHNPSTPFIFFLNKLPDFSLNSLLSFGIVNFFNFHLRVRYTVYIFCVLSVCMISVFVCMCVYIVCRSNFLSSNYKIEVKIN